MKNIIDAILTLIHQNNFDLVENNSAKDAKHNDFKDYVKYLFDYSFSYVGTQAEFPDLMLKEGDAVEIKIIRGNSDEDIFESNSDEDIFEEDYVDNLYLFNKNKNLSKKNIELNPFSGDVLLSNVPPMQFLNLQSPLISKNCRNVIYEEGNSLFVRIPLQRDIIYVVGIIKENQIRSLSMVYGRDYCASNDYYKNIRNRIKKLYENEKELIQDNLEKVKELARIINFDPLGLTQVRLNANWQIKNPWQAFNYAYQRQKESEFDFFCIINYDKWKTLENRGILLHIEKYYPNLKIKNVRIKNPDNPEERRDAVLITYEI